MTNKTQTNNSDAQPAPAQQPEALPLALECADYATSLRSVIMLAKLEQGAEPASMVRAAGLFERAAAYIAELEAMQAAPPAPVEHAATLWVEENGCIDFETSPFFVKPPGEYQLYTATPAPAAVPVLYVSPEQLAKHLDLEGAKNAEAGRYLPARKTPAGKFTQPLYAIAAAPAQAWPSECDSPELCRVHRGCAGQYGTKNICPSFAVLNPCNSAAPAQENATQLAGQGQFQQRVQPWLLECFGAEIAGDKAERNHRFLEEALELVQACGCTASEAHQLVDYVFGRPVGEPAQEVGGVMVTLAALCYANGLDMHTAGETELERISVPAMMAKIKAKQAAKPKHSPLPAAPAQAQEDARLEKPARVGCGTFGIGVPSRLVVEAAQRLFEFEGKREAMTPDEQRDMERRRRELWDMINGPFEAQEGALDHAELQEILRAVDQFADCGETDVDYALLMRAAQAGYLECTHFQVMNESALNLDAARAAQGGA